MRRAKKLRVSGYTFTGWNTKADGSGTAYAAGATYKKDAKVTLYAQWKKNADTGIFKDILITDWQYVHAKFVYDKGYMSGKGKTDDGKIVFDPNGMITRGEFATVLYNFEGRPQVYYKKNFSDVPDGQWYTMPVTWAYNCGIVSGYGAKFGVNDKITREQLAQILYAYAKIRKYSTTADLVAIEKFADAGKVSSWATNAMNWAVTNKIMSGKGTNLDPLGYATRAECAAMIKNFCERFVK